MGSFLRLKSGLSAAAATALVAFSIVSAPGVAAELKAAHFMPPMHPMTVAS